MRLPRVWWLLALLLSHCSHGPRTPQAGEQTPSAEVRARRYTADSREAKRAGDLDAAFQLAARALVVRIAHFGPEHPQVAYSFYELAELRRAAGQFAAAEHTYVRALTLLEPIRQGEPVWVGLIARRLASLLRERGRRAKASVIERRYPEHRLRASAPKR